MSDTLDETMLLVKKMLGRIESNTSKWGRREKIIATHAVSEDRLRALKTSMDGMGHHQDAAAALAADLIENFARAKTDFWNTIAALADCTDYFDFTRKHPHHLLRVNWVTGIEVVDLQPEPEPQQSAIALLQAAKELLVADANFDAASKVRDLMDTLKPQEQP